MSTIAYYRVSTVEQSVESQRAELGGMFDKEFKDEGVSGATLAADRPGFAQLLAYVRDGDSLHVSAIDRLGRDALDVQATVKALRAKGVKVVVHGLGEIAEGVGDLILGVLSQVAEMERKRIAERTAAGRSVAKELLEKTGKTQHGKTSMGRPMAVDKSIVMDWRKSNKASIAQTAEHFGISSATVKRYCCKES